jgi:acyl-CoA thioester hydrolase
MSAPGRPSPSATPGAERGDSHPLPADPEETRREQFPHLLEIPTRWQDNDVYGHVNNVEYYSFFDTVINRWLITEGGLDIHGDGEAVGFCVESRCAFHGPLSFPDTVEAALRVGHLGRSSVRYEIALFGAAAERPVATGWFVHVFVDPTSRRPVEIPPALRGCMERLAPNDGEPGSEERGR